MILAIDQGTSSTKTLIFNVDGQVVARASEPLKTQYWGDGYVEQDPEEIYRNVLTSVGKCLGDFAASGGNLRSVAVSGISNQRETFVVWNRAGKPLHNAIVWQCKRSIAICERLKADGLEPMVRQKTGLFIDPYFSGTKLIWLNENVPSVQAAIEANDAFFGTVDTWLLYRLTNGACYRTDYTNASRTLFFNLQTLRWDQELLARFGLSKLNLPEPTPSAALFGESTFNGLFDHAVQLTAMIGDSHAAAFGEGCFSTGTAKATLGTGCSIIMNIGPELKESGHGMVSTICWSTEERVDYALEGVIVTCGATIEWLKNSLELFAESRETEAMARNVPDNGGVYLIPAFSGLGAPHWQMERKASIAGMTFGTTKSHLVRAALESIPYQIKDVVVAMEQDTGIPLAELMVNGGLTSNGFVLQFLADLLEKPVINRGMPDVSAQGAAYLAGLKAGIFHDLAHLERIATDKSAIEPTTNKAAANGYEGWQVAVSKAY
ncbi:FGGY family carbohydrate kinase [Fibrella forsythiae]|uniref:ATP:glycerol 3-phosphotransferase n=1 Tax=Fibrella forsythiae TaxID=2817061 RepID=A0ABS3JIC9_9BACT|nr:glycerol kinase GlpK [Fibrella forsythiae]MBO0948617.1 glycerol kinase GlpK [Fibrella forsythiae]